MKKTIILTLACIVAAVAVAQQFAAHTKSMTAFASSASFMWTATEYDFGKIKLNEPVTHEFTFTNSGNEPLIINSVKAACGCTVTEYTKSPIAPGGEGYVKATYNAAKAGVFSKTVTLQANTNDENVVLTIKGEVVE